MNNSETEGNAVKVFTFRQREWRVEEPCITQMQPQNTKTDVETHLRVPIRNGRRLSSAPAGNEGVASVGGCSAY